MNKIFLLLSLITCAASHSVDFNILKEGSKSTAAPVAALRLCQKPIDEIKPPLIDITAQRTKNTK